MDKGSKILSDIQVHDKYGRYLKGEQRRETWQEIVDRNKDMHLEFYKEAIVKHGQWLEDKIHEAYKYVERMEVMPSMRSLQFAGKPILISHNRIYNCSYMPIDNVACFGEAMFLLLGGSGVGYSVRRRHVNSLPPIRKGLAYRRYVIADSKEGWADAVKVLMKGYLGLSKTIPRFDFSDIREKGAELKTSGGKAPGPKPLRDTLFAIESILMEKRDGSYLTPLEVHDIMCHIANAVLAGGIRRSAMIVLFDPDDEEMMFCKTGSWWETNPQRGRANNSAALHRDDEKNFRKVFDVLRHSGYGEPGFFWTNNDDWGLNPCAEIGLQPYQFCNLTNVNVTDINKDNIKEFYRRVGAAALIGTLQAGYTDFHYLRPVWKETTESDSLLGIGLIGIASGGLLEAGGDVLRMAAKLAKVSNMTIAPAIGIKPAARLTCVKPDGNSSVLLGTSPGVHAWHSKHFIRTARITKNSAVYDLLMESIPDLVEDDLEKPMEQAVVSIPVKAPEGAITKGDETALDLLNRVSLIMRTWVKTGHRWGDNTHNVSVTVNVKDDEWDAVEAWLWDNREGYSAVALLPHFDHKYKQAPYQEITEDEYNELIKKCVDVDFSNLREGDDFTKRENELACAGGACEI